MFKPTQNPSTYKRKHSFACLIAATFAIASIFIANPSHLSAQSSSKTAQEDALGLEGYCPVCIIKMKKWVKGNEQFKSVYDGKTYLFPSEKEKEVFDKSPADFVPALGGDCVVCLKKMNKRVAGNIRHSSFLDGRLFLFPNEDVKKAFAANTDAYNNVDLAYEGKCAVCSVEMKKSVDGNAAHTVMHNGIRYRFPGKEQAKMFMSNPDKYAVKSAHVHSGNEKK